MLRKYSLGWCQFASPHPSQEALRWTLGALFQSCTSECEYLCCILNFIQTYLRACMQKFLLLQVSLRGEKFHFATSLRSVQLYNLQCGFGKSDCLKKALCAAACWRLCFLLNMSMCACTPSIHLIVTSCLKLTVYCKSQIP